MLNNDKNELLQLLIDTFQKYCPVRTVSRYSRDYHVHNMETLRNIFSRYGGRDIKILFVSVYNPKYTRTESLLQEFESLHLRYTPVFFRGIFRYFRLLFYLLRNSKKYDAVFLNFRGHEVLPFVKLVTRKPVIFDCFVSAYDTLCFDRKIFKPDSLPGKLLLLFDKWLCRISDIVLVDTGAHVDYFRKMFGINNVFWLYVGCNESLFHSEKKSHAKSDVLKVFWHGNALPLQGVETILQVISDLSLNNAFHFTVVGPVLRKYRHRINDKHMKNTTFLKWVPYESLPEYINASDVCLGGPFSASIPKASRVIPGKTYQYIACSKPTIIADNKVHAEIF